MRNRIGGDRGIKTPEYITGECPPNFGFPEGRLQEVHQNPDQTHVLIWEGLEIRLFLKAATKFTDVVAVQWTPQPRMVSFAMRTFPSLCDTPLGDFTPLQLVERVAEKYGLEVTIAEKKGKFFLCEKLDMPKGVPGTQLTQVTNPNNHEFVQSFFIKVTPPVVSVALAFCLDTREYGNWLRNH
jgi:hypothetical protein